MDNEREKEIIEFLKTVSLEGDGRALDLLLKFVTDKVEKDIGGFKVPLTTYNTIVEDLKNNCKIKAIKVLKDAYGRGHSLREYKVAVESLGIIPELKE
jgi:hypothetical protein